MTTHTLTRHPIIVDPRPTNLGKAHPYTHTYRLGHPAHGLPAGTLIVHTEWSCCCVANVDPNCGHLGCYGHPFKVA